MTFWEYVGPDRNPIFEEAQQVCLTQGEDYESMNGNSWDGEEVMDNLTKLARIERKWQKACRYCQHTKTFGDYTICTWGMPQEWFIPQKF